MREKNKIKLQKRTRRHLHLKKHVRGTTERPRVSVYRSLQNIYAQIIDDIQQKTLVAASNLSPQYKEKFKGTVKKKEISEKVGLLLAELAKQKGIEKVFFDRSGYLYHGRIKALADGARKGGLKF
jgi:large subunit ribosomal protein L18